MVDIFLALPLAGIVNRGMLVMAAVTFHGARTKVTDLASAYHTLDSLLGRCTATVFAVCAAVIIALNTLLICRPFGGLLPGAD